MGDVPHQFHFEQQSFSSHAPWSGPEPVDARRQEFVELSLQLVFAVGVIQVCSHQRVLGGCDAQDGLFRWLLQLTADEQLVEDVVGLVCASKVRLAYMCMCVYYEL